MTRLFLILLLFFYSCQKDTNSSPEPEDCAGISGGSNVCGCTDSTAFNYNSSATYDDGSCQAFISNGEFFLSFNGSNNYVDLGDMLSVGSYTKTAWVKRESGNNNNNIMSGDEGHALWAPHNYDYKLSSGHQPWNAVQDAEPLEVGVWYFVSVTYEITSQTMTLYKNGVEVDQATGIEGPAESSKTYIGKYASGSYWIGAIDEAGIWDRALSSMEIEQLYNMGNGIIARKANTEDQDLVLEAKGYWKINEGIGEVLSDASGHGNVGSINGASWSTCDGCGCTDSDACNYDETVTIDNGSCVYVQQPCESCEDGVIIDNDFDGDGICNIDDNDDDNDGVTDLDDSDPLDNTSCSDNDQDGCDDCSSGTYDLSNDGADDDGDGICNSYIIEGRTVYIAGSSYNSDGNYTACYWVDGVRVELPGGAWATDIVVVNGTVYTSGTGETSDACYWIDQTRYDLPGLWGEAEGIAVHNGDVYVAGWYENGSCYWKNGQKIDLTVNRDSQAFAIGVRDNGMVYVGGYYMNNHHYIIPCFWKDGNNRTNLPIPSGGDGEVYDIAIMDGNMRYYAGVALHTSSFAGYTPKACYWRHTTRTDLQLGGSTFDIYGAGAYGITIDGSDIYTAGYTDWFGQGPEPSGGSYPQYWKNNNIHDLEGGPLNSWGTGTAYDIRVADGNVVAVGIATVESPDPTTPEGSFTAPCYWLNGELHFLVNQYDVPQEIERWMDGDAKGVFIE